ncbi:hypothetical protein [Ekhidna sp.]|uniref:hypothetical protein n=1 Tax=Ekhidna sp. TaxID=2608089 RepID=UPI003CCC14CF
MKPSINNSQRESKAILFAMNNKRILSSKKDPNVWDAYAAFQQEVEDEIDFELFDDNFYDI